MQAFPPAFATCLIKKRASVCSTPAHLTSYFLAAIRARKNAPLLTAKCIKDAT